MVQVIPTATQGATISDTLFGGNILANSYDLSPDGGVDPLIDELGLTSLRYPGGSLTETFFDITDPDADTVFRDDGEEIDFIPLSEMMAFAEAKDVSLTIVIPTRYFLSEERDASGNRVPEFDEEELRGFVRDVQTGVYGDADVNAFEIGNEYWGSGQMNAVEYGRLASEMAEVIDDELRLIEIETGETIDTDIVVQAGTNSGYSQLNDEFEQYETTEEKLAAINERFDADFGDEILSASGTINWRVLNDKLVAREFDEDEQEAVDGVAIHLYSRSQIRDGHRDYALDQLDKTWDEEFGSPDIYVTEWNVKANTPELDPDEDYGLSKAHEILNILETMADSGVERAQVWPLIQNSSNALTRVNADQELSPGGTLFSLMSDSLPGKTVLDFTPERTDTTEFRTETIDTHGFYGDGELVFYIASNADGSVSEDVDLSSMIESGGTVSARVIGVAEGQNPGSDRSTAVVRELDGEEIFQDGVLEVDLGEQEILEVRITAFEPTEEFEETMDAIDNPSEISAAPAIVSDFGDGGDVPLIPWGDLEFDDENEEAEDDDDGGMGDMLALLLLPLALVGMMGM